MLGLPQLHLSRALPLPSVLALRPLHLMWAGSCGGSCAEVAQLEELWGKGAEGQQLVVVWEGDGHT